MTITTDSSEPRNPLAPTLGAAQAPPGNPLASRPVCPFHPQCLARPCYPRALGAFMHGQAGEGARVLPCAPQYHSSTTLTYTTCCTCLPWPSTSTCYTHELYSHHYRRHRRRLHPCPNWCCPLAHLATPSQKVTIHDARATCQLSLKRASRSALYLSPQVHILVLSVNVVGEADHRSRWSFCLPVLDFACFDPFLTKTPNGFQSK